MNSWMHNVRPQRGDAAPTLYIHPRDAAARGIVTGDLVDVRTSAGTIRVKAEITEDIHPGAVSYPHGWGHGGGWSTAIGHGGANINAIIPNDVDKKERISGMSYMDGIPVRVTPARIDSEGTS